MDMDYSQLRDETISYKKCVGGYKIIGNEPIAFNEGDMSGYSSFIKHPKQCNDPELDKSPIYSLTKSLNSEPPKKINRHQHVYISDIDLKVYTYVY